MNDEKLIALLQILANNGNLFLLVYDETITYSDISSQINSLVRDGYIKKNDTGYSITIKGQKLAEEINRRLKRRGIYRYISPDPRATGPQLRAATAYFPNKY